MVKSSNLITNNEYEYERIFGQSSRQSEVYNELSDLLYSVYEGMNVCIFAYGNTGSGKTYTIFGGQKEEEKGLLPRTLENIKERIESTPHTQYSIRYCFSELYSDRLFDLHQAMFSDTSPGPVKYALSRVHDWFSPEVRLPIIAANDASRAAVDAALSAAGVI